MRIVGYARVSTRKQAEGESIEAQEKEIREWAAAHGHEVVAVFVDGGESGKLDALERDGLLDSLGLIEDGDGDALAMRDLGRLARALHVQEAILARAWSAAAQVWEVARDSLVLEDDPDDPMRTFVRQVMGAGHQLEGALISSRLQRARRVKAKGGGYVGGKEPYGWERRGEGRDAVLVKLPDEQRVLGRMKRLRKQGGKSYRAIAAALNGDGIPAKGGGRWHHTAVRSVLVRAEAA